MNEYWDYNDHHIFPQNEMMSEWFADRGINVHHYTVTLDRVDHDIIHTWWNYEWEAFMASEPPDRYYTTGEIQDKAAQMMEDAGILDSYIHGYRRDE